MLCRRWPRGEWWWKSWVLGILNIGAFFALLFIAAYRLPGGVAAIVGGLQPLVVAVLASRVLQERLTARVVLAGSSGLLGVCLIVLQAQSRLDAVGLAAAIGGTLSMASGIVLTKKWGQPASSLTTTAWQLIAGGLFLLVLTIAIEGLPTTPLTLPNIMGFSYLSVLDTAFAYVVWFRGIARLPTSTAAFLGLLSPVVAILLGWMIAGEDLAPLQVAGVVIVLFSIATVIVSKTAKKQGCHRSLWCGRNGGDQRGYRLAPAVSDSVFAADISRSAAFSPMTIDTAWVCPRMMSGITDASATRRPCTPRTRNSSSTTEAASVPIRAVPTGWYSVCAAVSSAVPSRSSRLIVSPPSGATNRGPVVDCSAGACRMSSQMPRPAISRARSVPPASVRYRGSMIAFSSGSAEARVIVPVLSGFSRIAPTVSA